MTRDFPLWIKKRIASGNAKVFPHGTFKKDRNITLQQKLQRIENETELLHFARGRKFAPNLPQWTPDEIAQIKERLWILRNS